MLFLSLDKMMIFIAYALREGLLWGRANRLYSYEYFKLFTFSYVFNYFEMQVNSSTSLVEMPIERDKSLQVFV